MVKKTCPNCQSTRIISNADAVETKNPSIRIYERPETPLRGVRPYSLKALARVECGYGRLYVNQPRELAGSYQRHLGRG